MIDNVTSTTTLKKNRVIGVIARSITLRKDNDTH
jgi:hypothetical protein